MEKEREFSVKSYTEWMNFKSYNTGLMSQEIEPPSASTMILSYVVEPYFRKLLEYQNSGSFSLYHLESISICASNNTNKLMLAR